jgi:hypothetical protein
MAVQLAFSQKTKQPLSSLIDWMRVEHTGLLLHNSILSNNGASTKPGALQIAVAPVG